MLHQFHRGDKLTNGEIIVETKSVTKSFSILRLTEKRYALFITEHLFTDLKNNVAISEFMANKFTNCEEGYYYASKPQYNIYAVIAGPYANSFDEIMNLCSAFKSYKEQEGQEVLSDLVYIEEFDILLPIKDNDSETFTEDMLLGSWLSDGLHVSVNDYNKLCLVNLWLEEESIKKAIDASGLKMDKKVSEKAELDLCNNENGIKQLSFKGKFELPGRDTLSKYFNDEIVDFVQNMDKYEKMGITGIPATLLYGKPGGGKTYAVEKLAEFLGLPCFEINSSTVASPYIHESSKKIAQVFDKAIKAAPSVLIIDEMEAYVSSRSNNDTETHHIEEVDEFLRNIPKAIAAKVIIFGMTNMLDMIDPAILRKGRFDFIKEVGMPSKQEIIAVLKNGLGNMPTTDDINIENIADGLLNRPMSDISYIIRQAARIAVRQGCDKVANIHLLQAVESLSTLKNNETEKRRIGF